MKRPFGENPGKKRRQLVRNLSAFEDEVEERERAYVLPMPSTISQAFQWAFHLLSSFALLLGDAFVKQRLRTLNWRVSTYFSGMDCAWFALEQLDAACVEMWGFHIKVTHGTMSELDPSCQRWLQQRYPQRCLFPDILAFPLVKPQSAEWQVDTLKLNKAHYCLTHSRHCSRNQGVASPGWCDVDVSGPPCVLFSNFGKHEGLGNATKARVHSVWIKTKIVDRSPLVVHENVPGFPEDRTCMPLSSHLASIRLHLYLVPRTCWRPTSAATRSTGLPWTHVSSASPSAAPGCTGSCMMRQSAPGHRNTHVKS